MKCAFIADTGTGDMNQRLVGKGLSELVKNKSKDMTKAEAEKYCKDEINKKIGK